MTVLNAFDLYFNNREQIKDEEVKNKDLLKNGMRKCRDCKQVKPFEDFSKKGKRAGRQETRAECKLCSSIRRKIRIGTGGTW